MKYKMNLLIVLTIFASLVYQAQAVDNMTSGSSAGEFSKVGVAGAQFVKIPVGARANGMGAYAAVANDLTSIYWNPAGLAEVKYMAGNFSYSSWFSDFQQSFAAMSLPIGDYFTSALSFNTFGCDKIERTTLERPEGTGTYYSVNDFAIGLSLAGYLTEQFSFGVTGKYLYNSIADLDASGFAFDIGTKYETGIQGIKLAFSIHNLGTRMTYSGQDLNSTKKIVNELYMQPLDVQYLTSSYNVPLIFRAGIASDVYTDEDHNVTAAFDFLTLSESPEQFVLGAEWTWKRILSVRGGYRFGHDQFGLCGGIGLSYIAGGVGGQIDYSITPTQDIGIVNRISLNLDLR
ncbi:MAG: PorV/PorQ family protein [Ignavibacteria bacterium]|nr:PorV/PorQ family protein [Ignavibacteria bacterium]